MGFDGGAGLPELTPWFRPDIRAIRPDGSIWVNREDEDPFRVRLRVMSGKELDRLETKHALALAKENQGLTTTELEDLIEAKMVEDCVLEVHGWRSPSASVIGKVWDAKTSKELLAALDDGDPEARRITRPAILRGMKSHSVLEAGLWGESKRSSAISATQVIPQENTDAVAADDLTREQ